MTDEAGKAVAILCLQRRSMLTVPRELRQRIKLEEGQPLMVRIVDARRLLIEVIPTLHPDDLFAQYPINTKVEDDWHDTMAAHHPSPDVPHNDGGRRRHQCICACAIQRRAYVGVPCSPPGGDHWRHRPSPRSPRAA